MHESQDGLKSNLSVIAWSESGRWFRRGSGLIGRLIYGTPRWFCAGNWVESNPPPCPTHLVFFFSERTKNGVLTVFIWLRRPIKHVRLRTAYVVKVVVVVVVRVGWAWSPRREALMGNLAVCLAGNRRRKQMGGRWRIYSFLAHTDSVVGQFHLLSNGSFWQAARRQQQQQRRQTNLTLLQRSDAAAAAFLRSELCSKCRITLRPVN